jgi:hypothetical protein
MKRTWLKVGANMEMRAITKLSRRKKQIGKKIHSEKLHNLYISQNIIMRFNSRIDGAYGMSGREGNFMQKFGGKTSRKAAT